MKKIQYGGLKEKSASHVFAPSKRGNFLFFLGAGDSILKSKEIERIHGGWNGKGVVRAFDSTGNFFSIDVTYGFY